MGGFGRILEKKERITGILREIGEESRGKKHSELQGDLSRYRLSARNSLPENTKKSTIVFYSGCVSLRIICVSPEPQMWV
jgi:hypothetical protein